MGYDMALLILYDSEGRQEIGRREAIDSERYAFYQMYQDKDLFTFDGKRYRLHTVAWNPQTEEIVLRGTFDSYEAGFVDCE